MPLSVQDDSRFGSHMARLRGGVFGCGMISEFHLRGWQRIPEVEIVALGNRTIARAEARRDQFFPGAQIYADLGRMLKEERLDFVDILTVPWLHREHGLLARAANVHSSARNRFATRWKT